MLKKFKYSTELINSPRVLYLGRASIVKVIFIKDRTEWLPTKSLLKIPGLGRAGVQTPGATHLHDSVLFPH